LAGERPAQVESCTAMVSIQVEATPMIGLDNASSS